MFNPETACMFLPINVFRCGNYFFELTEMNKKLRLRGAFFISTGKDNFGSAWIVGEIKWRKGPETWIKGIKKAPQDSEVRN